LTTHLVLPDPHSHPDFNNDRADYVGRLIVDIQPDVFVNLGDMWDFASLSGYDKGKSSFHGRNYQRDLDAGLDFNDRLFAPIRKAKRKQPRSIFIEGNHEQRQARLLDMQPELDGAISFKDLDLQRSYDTVVRYTGQTPGSIEIDGVTFAHFVVSGIMGRAIGGEHPAYSLLTKQFQSVVQGHTHTFDYCERTNMAGQKVQALVAGWFGDYVAPWAGTEICKMWAPGVAILHDVEDGHYDLEWVSLNRLKKEYGKDSQD
jgi:hypothetical protein